MAGDSKYFKNIFKNATPAQSIPTNDSTKFIYFLGDSESQKRIESAGQAGQLASREEREKHEPKQVGQTHGNTNLGHAGRETDYHARKRGGRNPMGRYPWTHSVNVFVRQQLDEGDWSDATAYERGRLLERIHRDLKTVLRARAHEIPPKTLKTEHVRAYIVWLRTRSKRNGSTQRKALLLLSDFLLFVGNTSGMKLHKQFPCESASNRPRPPFAELSQGFDRLDTIEDDWQRSIARGQGAIYIGTMVRPSEGRLALLGDLDIQSWALRVRNPKGHTRERIAPFINPRCKVEMTRYLSERASKMKLKGLDPTDPTKPLFPSFGRGNELRHYTPQGFNNAWRKAWPGREHYCARRGMAQEAVDRDPKLLGTVSKMLGHSNIGTTMKYYADPRIEQVRTELEKVWADPNQLRPIGKPQLDPSYA